MTELLPWPGLFGGAEVREVSPRCEPGEVAADLLSHAEVVRREDLRAFVQGAVDAGEALTLVINDTHRPTDTAGFLAALAADIDARGAPWPSLRVLVAAGSHRSDEAERALHEANSLGPLGDRVGEVRWHDARDDATLTAVGSYRMNSWMAEAGRYLAVGSVEPHYFAGATGAHKTLTVGVLAMDDLRDNHENALSRLAAPLVLDGNPVFDAIRANFDALLASGARTFAINQIFAGKGLLGVTAGEPLRALHEALPTARACFGAAVAHPVDVLIATVEAPLDRDLYQAEKGIKNCEFAVRDGGRIVLDAACTHGVGIDHFFDLLREAPTHAAAVARVAERGYRLGDHKAVRLRALLDSRGVELGIVSRGLDRSAAEVVGAKLFSTRAEAAAWAGEAGPKTVVVHDAANVALQVESSL